MEKFVVDTAYNAPEINVYQDLGHRDRQEDFYLITRLSQGQLIAVADGHNGLGAASLATKNLPLIFSEEIDKFPTRVSPSQVRSAIRKTFKRLTEATKTETSGTTLTVAFLETGTLRPSFDPAVRVTVGQLGDSIFAISSKLGKLDIAPRHNAQEQHKDIIEIKALYRDKYGEECKSSYAYIYSAPIKCDGLALTRSLGDSAFTLIRKPVIKTYLVDPKQTVLLIATDGILANNINPRLCIKSIIDQIRQGKQVAEITQSLGHLEDNTTILAVSYPRKACSTNNS